MRAITGSLTPELSAVVGDQPVQRAPALGIKTYPELMHHVARLAYANKDYLLFFRGQATDYKNKANSSSFYPSIYRGERLAQGEVDLRFGILASASKRLSDAFLKQKIEGASDVRKRRLIQWSILQHYEVCATPLLDFTQSVRVACSFALMDSTNEDPYVFIFGMPYMTNRVSVNSEHDLVNIRLLSICPPDALRPYYQEGYLAGTDDITNDYQSKSELDFNNRLIAKFQISRGADFWGIGFDAIPRGALYPPNDKIKRLCEEISDDVTSGIEAAELGTFLQLWSSIESRLLSLARDRKERVYSALDAIQILRQAEMLPFDIIRRIDLLRKIRNMAVHQPEKLTGGQLSSSSSDLRLIADALRDIQSTSTRSAL